MENSFNIEIDNKNKKIIQIIIILYGFILLCVITYLTVNSDDLTKKQILSIERNTRVIDIFRDKKNHNFPYVKFSNGKTIGLDEPYQVGDSISKKKGDSIEYIFRKDRIIKNNLLEEVRRDRGFKIKKKK